MVGFPGSGKSYWGERLARRLARPFIDLDEFIESQTGWPIPRLFAQLGEPAFRAVERAALLALPGMPGAVIACGGGTPCFFDNLAWMQRHGRTIFLDVPPDVLIARLWAERSTRPLLRDVPADEFAAEVAGRLAARRPWYERADCRVRYDPDEPVLEKRLLAAL